MATITATATEILKATVTKTVTSASASSTVRASPQGGILEGGNPSVYSPTNPIVIFIIQASIIIIFCRLLHYPLSLMHQPRVIAEVIGGILLGPSVMGHVPGFTAAIFPTASIPNLTLVANLGLVLFLFLVGLEVDVRYFVSNWKVALSVGTAGMALPFGLGCAVAWGIYHQFQDEPGTKPIAFGTYMLFIGVAMAITAFPVLCRILTELKLLSTPVGIIVLSAGVSNDIVGWILLALCVALVNASSGLTALWVLLCCIGYVLFLVFAVRPAFMWLLRRTGALQDGPSQSVVLVTLMICLISAFFTSAIGVHPIFGAFLAGLICPHEGGFAIKVTEKVEDLVSTIFLPLYFALSGLSTNLGLLNNGITWAYVVIIIVVAFTAKFIGGTLGARVNGLLWRESFTIGILMSCKGLVELIVLNIGLQAKILSTRTFTMFVVMALVTTFLTTPLTSALYPPWYQARIQAWKRGDIDWDTGKRVDATGAEFTDASKEVLAIPQAQRLLVYLRLDNMAPLMAFVAMFGGQSAEPVRRQHPTKGKTSGPHDVTATVQSGPIAPKPIDLHGIRLLELTERNSSVMKVSEVEEYTAFDPVLNVFRVLGQLYNLAVSGEVAVVPANSYAATLTSKAEDESSDLLLLPWSETGSLSETQAITSDHVSNKLTSDAYSAFVTKTFDYGKCNVGVFINKGFSSASNRPTTASTPKSGRPQLYRSMSASSAYSYPERVKTTITGDRSHHIFMPFFGGADCRLGVRLVLQMLENPDVTATIVKYELKSRPHALREEDDAFLESAQASLSPDVAERVMFGSASSETLLADAIRQASTEIAQNPKNGGDVIVLGRNVDSTAVYNSPGAACLGLAADAFASGGVNASLLVVQSKPSESD